jgi:hypothetical protein
MFGHCASFSMTFGQRGPSSTARLRSAACAVASTASVAIAIPATVHFDFRVTKNPCRERVKFEANCFQFVACVGVTIRTDHAIVNGRINHEFRRSDFVIRVTPDPRQSGLFPLAL